MPPWPALILPARKSFDLSVCGMCRVRNIWKQDLPRFDRCRLPTPQRHYICGVPSQTALSKVTIFGSSSPRTLGRIHLLAQAALGIYSTQLHVSLECGITRASAGDDDHRQAHVQVPFIQMGNTKKAVMSRSSRDEASHRFTWPLFMPCASSLHRSVRWRIL
jgi:hypothetical protein